MTLYRAIWLVFFGIGAYALTGFVLTFDTWAANTAIPGSEMYCHGTLGGHIPVTRAPLCLAVWFNEAKAWVAHAREMLFLSGHGLHGNAVMHTADVGLFTIGGLAAVTALNWLWATAMAQVTVAVFAASFTLTHGLSQILRGGRAV